MLTAQTGAVKRRAAQRGKPPRRFALVRPPAPAILNAGDCRHRHTGIRAVDAIRHDDMQGGGARGSAAAPVAETTPSAGGDGRAAPVGCVSIRPAVSERRPSRSEQCVKPRRAGAQASRHPHAPIPAGVLYESVQNMSRIHLLYRMTRARGSLYASADESPKTTIETVRPECSLHRFGVRYDRHARRTNRRAR